MKTYTDEKGHTFNELGSLSSCCHSCGTEWAGANVYNQPCPHKRDTTYREKASLAYWLWLKDKYPNCSPTAHDEYLLNKYLGGI